MIDSTELTDLRAIVSDTALFGPSDYVRTLSSYIVSGNTANAKYQGQALGNLAAGSTATLMEQLVDKWFLGLDHPTAGGTYRLVSGSLFVNGVCVHRHPPGHAGRLLFHVLARRDRP